MVASTTTLNDVCIFIEDCLHATAPTVKEGIPLVRTPNIGRGRLNLEGVQRVTLDTYLQWTRRAAPRAGDLILAREAPAGNVALVAHGQTVCLGQRTVHLRPDPTQVDPGFLCYFLLTPKMQGLLLAAETGATAKHVNMKDIRRLPLVALPSLEQQKRIGSIVGSFDDLIEKNRRRIKLLEEAARLIYREWFVHLRFPGHEHTKIVDGLPEGWRRSTLGFEASIQMGQSPDSSFYNFEERGLPFHQGVKDFGTRFPSTSTWCDGPGRKALKGDILLSVRAPVGRLNLAPCDLVIGRGLAAVRAKDQRQSLLFHHLKAFFFTEDRIGTGVIYASVTKDDVHRIEVIKASEIVADEFERSVGQIEAQIAVLGEAIQRLGRARDLLLPRLMSGEIEV